MPRVKKEPCNVNTTNEHYEAMLWCFRNKIFVKPKANKNGEVLLEIHNSYKNSKNRVTFSPKAYTKCAANQEIWDLYVKLFDKYGKGSTFNGK
jgi:hypothetical protein